MAVRVVYRDGETVSVFPVREGGATLVIVPFAKDDAEGTYVGATACSVFLPGHDDTKELSLGLYIFDPRSDELHDYRLEEALERLPQEVWLSYCVATSFAARAILTIENLEMFHIYVPSYRHDSQLASMLGIVANAVAHDFELRRVDEFLGSVLWVGVRKKGREDET